MNFSLRLLSWLSLAAVSVRADSGQDKNGNYYNQFTVCDDSYIEIEELTLLCDSPGTYYYGSGKYRNSASCQAGDKAKLSIVFKMNADLSDMYEQMYLDVFVSGYGTVQGVQIWQNEDMCEISNLSPLDGQACGEQGEYKLYYYYHWGSQSDNYEYSFVPKVSVGFTSNPNNGVYDLGGANTNDCSGDTFTNWTKGVRKSAANTIKTFFATFGILLCSVLAVFAAGWVIMKQTRNRPKEIVVDDPLDDSNEKHKVALVGDSKNNLLVMT